MPLTARRAPVVEPDGTIQLNAHPEALLAEWAAVPNNAGAAAINRATCTRHKNWRPTYFKVAPIITISSIDLGRRALCVQCTAAVLPRGASSRLAAAKSKNGHVAHAGETVPGGEHQRAPALLVINPVGRPHGPLSLKPLFEMMADGGVEGRKPARLALHERPDRMEVVRERCLGLLAPDILEGSIDAAVPLSGHGPHKALVLLTCQDDIDVDLAVLADGRVQLKKTPRAREVCWIPPRLQHGQNPSDRKNSGAKLGGQFLWSGNFFGDAVLVEAEGAHPDVRPRWGPTRSFGPSEQRRPHRDHAVAPRVRQ
mmetsp:Transcript_15690/g.40610  ORF Transcript_15690/g.40610 Transcript_15690/m.40610 type:complete len:312 (+) Transcript_15690:318-1253(+)